MCLRSREPIPDIPEEALPADEIRGKNMIDLNYLKTWVLTLASTGEDIRRDRSKLQEI